MPVLSIRVQVAAVVEGNALKEEHFRGKPDGVQCFLLGAWVGGGNPDFAMARVAPDGTAALTLNVRHGDVDAVKFALTFNLYTPKGGRNCAVSANYLPVDDLMGRLRASLGKKQFDNGQTPFSMADNFTKNQVFLRFLNNGTSLRDFAPSVLKLRPSSLRALERTSAAVCMMGKQMQEKITSSFAVCQLNAGPQYVQSYTYWNMQQALTNYALLGHLLSKLAPGVDLAWIVYDAYLAVQSTGLNLKTLAAMPMWALILRFGVQLINRHTACALTSVYNTDFALGPISNAACKVKPTEDIARTFGKMSMWAMGLNTAKPFVRPSRAPGFSLEGSVAAVGAAVQTRRVGGLDRRVSFCAVADDCENLSASIIQKATRLRLMYEGLASQLGDGATLDGLAPLLCRQMDAITASNPLFARIGPGDNRLMSRVLLSLGEALHSGDWSVALTVVSAKGPEYAEGSTNPSASLSGHGTVVSRSKGCDGGWIHVPVEGTTYITTNLPPPPGYAQTITVPLEDGTHKTFPLTDFCTVMGQNVVQLVGSSQDCTTLAHLQSDYPSLSSCPFYVSAFYSGLGAGPGTIGCIPLDSRPPASFAAGEKSLFGAPVMGLSHPASLALPVTPDMLGETPEQGAAILGSLCDQMEELYPPALDSSDTLSSFWQPCASPSSVPDSCAPHRHVECNWAFDNPTDTDHAVLVYGALAKAFNALQAATPNSDGITASAFGQYLSATLNLHVPIPRADAAFTLTAVHNLRAAAEQLGLSRIAGCPIRLKRIAARASIPSDHHIYMCDRGEGPVHSHRVRLA
jgi:hypothetical protein